MKLGLLHEMDSLRATLDEQPNFVSFEHKSLQELAGAMYVKEVLEDSEKTEAQLQRLFPSWYDIMRFEEVVVFTVGLMKDPTLLIGHVCNAFSEMNTGYLSEEHKVPHDEKEIKLKSIGKTAVNLDFFKMLKSESKRTFPWPPLQNPYFNWISHAEIGKIRDMSNVYIPSKYYNFQNVRHPIGTSITEKAQTDVECSLVVDNPHASIVNDLLSICATICEHQPIVNLCLFDLNITSPQTKDIFKLGPSTRCIAVEDCFIHSSVCTSFLSQIGTCSYLSGIRFQNCELGKKGEFERGLSKAITIWPDPINLTYLVLLNCSLSEDECGRLLQSLAACKCLEYLNLSDNKLGRAAHHLATSIKSWGSNALLDSLYLADCAIPDNACGEIFQSLIECCRLTELCLAGNSLIESSQELINIITNSSSITQLTTLNLDNCLIPEENCGKIVKSLVTYRNFTTLDLSQNTVGKYGHQLAKSINQWGDNPPLKELYLYNCSIPENSCGEIVNSLVTCTNLTALNLSENTVGKYGHQFANSIRQWGDNPPLKELYLYNCLISEDSCGEIVDSLITCTNLTALSLSENTVGKYGHQLANSIRQWGDNPPLQELFLENCSILEDSCGEMVDSFVTCRNLTRLNLSENNVGKYGHQFANSIRQWGDNPPLKELALENCSIPEDSCGEIVDSLVTCKKLTTLNLSENTVGKYGHQFANSIRQWGDNPPLKELYLYNCLISEDSCGEIVDSLVTCTNLTALSLSENTVGKYGHQLANSIRQWGDNPPLQELFLENCSILEDSCGEMVDSFVTCRNLTRLNLSENNVGKYGHQFANSIRQWGDNPPLKELALENCSIPEDSCGEIVDSLVTCKKLTTLNLSENTVGKYGHQFANSIRQWGDNPPLKELYLHNCSILEDSCGEIVDSLVTCTNLTALNLSENTVGKYGHQFANSIRQWGHNPPLQELALENCSIPEDSCGEIVDSLVTCRNLTRLVLSQNTIGKYGHQLSNMIRHWGDNPPLQELALEKLFNT